MPATQKSGKKPEKTMSSRLLTMKFMQRAAATAAAKETSESPFADDTGSHTPKRPRLSTEPESDSPSKSRAELEAISAAVTAEEEKRREAIARQAAEAGETEWVLDYSTFGQFAPQPNVIEADSLDADDDEITGGRKSYGNFKRKKTGNKEADLSDPDEINAMVQKEKPKPKQPNLAKLTSISGAGGRPSSGGGDKKRKHK